MGASNKNHVAHEIDYSRRQQDIERATNILQAEARCLGRSDDGCRRHTESTDLYILHSSSKDGWADTIIPNDGTKKRFGEDKQNCTQAGTNKRRELHSSYESFGGARHFPISTAIRLPRLSNHVRRRCVEKGNKKRGVVSDRNSRVQGGLLNGSTEDSHAAGINQT